MSRFSHPSGLFTYTEWTEDVQGKHYTANILIKDTPPRGKAGMSVEWITELDGLLMGWDDKKELVFDVFTREAVMAYSGRSAEKLANRMAEYYRDYIYIPSRESKIMPITLTAAQAQEHLESHPSIRVESVPIDKLRYNHPVHIGLTTKIEKEPSSPFSSSSNAWHPPSERKGWRKKRQ